jgi:hypothetical protein
MSKRGEAQGKWSPKPLMKRVAVGSVCVVLIVGVLWKTYDQQGDAKADHSGKDPGTKGSSVTQNGAGR